MATADLLDRFGDYAIKVIQEYGHALSFEVKAIVGEAFIPSPAVLWMYQIKGAASSVETTTDFDAGEMFLHGEVKWDGCSNWDFHTTEIMAHFCGRQDAIGVGRLLDHLYQITEARLPTYDRTVAD